MNRRQFLGLAGAGVTVAVAGCGGGTDHPERGGARRTTAATANPPTPRNATPNIDHPAASDLAAQPTLGEFTGKVVIAFEDPSCPTCRGFYRHVYPKLQSKLIDTGKTAYVFRNYPVIYPWGKPASKALEATFQRDSAVGWDLLDFYFREQGSFDTDSVRAKTETYLNDETSVDGTAVIEAVERGEADAAVQADLDAGKAAGVGGRTPTFVLFRGDEYVTQVAGSVSYNTIATVLGA
ncbi:MAG: DsbA family protein [Halapricum sp.]